MRLPTERQIEVNWMSEKGSKFKKQGHKLVEHSTGWGTQKDSALWFWQKGVIGSAKLKF